MNWIRVQNKDNTSLELLKVVSQILESYLFILSQFSPGLILHKSFILVTLTEMIAENIVAKNSSFYEREGMLLKILLPCLG